MFEGFVETMFQVALAGPSPPPAYEMEAKRLERIMINELEDSNDGLQEGTVLRGKQVQQSLILYSTPRKTKTNWLGRLLMFFSNPGGHRTRQTGPSAPAKWFADWGRNVSKQFGSRRNSKVAPL